MGKYCHEMLEAGFDIGQKLKTFLSKVHDLNVFYVNFFIVIYEEKLQLLFY